MSDTYMVRLQQSICPFYYKDWTLSAQLLNKHRQGIILQAQRLISRFLTMSSLMSQNQPSQYIELSSFLESASSKLQTHSQLSQNHNDCCNEDIPNNPASKDLPFQTSLSDIKSQADPKQEINITKKVSVNSEVGSEQLSINSQDILVKTERTAFALHDIPVLKQKKPTFVKPYHNTTTRYNSNYYPNSFKNSRTNNQTKYINQKHKMYQQEPYNHYGSNYEPNEQREGNWDQTKRQEDNNKYDTIQPLPIPLSCYNSEYLTYYLQQQQMHQLYQAWLSHLWPNPYQYYLNHHYNCPVSTNNAQALTQIGNNPNITLTNAPISQNFGKICMPKYSITINNCILSITCCKLARLRGDVLLVPFYTTEEYLYPGLLYEEYWSTKEQIQKVIRRIKEKNMRNGEIEYQKTQLSSFKVIAFLKVGRINENNKSTNNKDDCFLTNFNRGLHALLSQSSNSSLNPYQPCKQIVIPYSFSFGSSQSKLNKIIDVLRQQSEEGYVRMTINCSQMRSFRRMCEGMGQAMSKLDEQGGIVF